MEAKVLPFSNGTKDNGSSCGGKTAKEPTPPDQTNKQRNKQTSKQTILTDLVTNLIVQT